MTPLDTTAPQNYTTTLSPTITQGVSSTPTVSITPAQVSTPFPTFSPEEAIDFVETLISTNGGCKLPCWWGITPGESTWDQAKTFFEKFAINIEQNKQTRFFVDYPYPEISAGWYRSVFIVDEEGIVELIIAPSGRGGSIQAILQKFGIPQEVWVRSTGFYMDVAPYQHLYFLYPEKGILVDFAGRGVISSHDGMDYLQFCSKEFGDFPLLYLWSPDSSKSLSYFYDNLPPMDYRYGRIGEVSNLDEALFYDLFSSAPNACFETRNDIWPELPTYTPTRQYGFTPTMTPWP